jgi:hypothetical protein
MSEMGMFSRGWRIWKDVDMDLDLLAWLNIEQVWTYTNRFTQLMLLKLLRQKDGERERERWGWKNEDEFFSLTLLCKNVCLSL